MSATTTAIFVTAKKSVTWSIVLSALMILAGVLAIFIPPAAGLAVTIFVGWLLVFSGVAHLVFAWQTRTSGASVLELLLGALYLLVGFYLLWNPVAGFFFLPPCFLLFLFPSAPFL